MIKHYKNIIKSMIQLFKINNKYSNYQLYCKFVYLFRRTHIFIALFVNKSFFIYTLLKINGICSTFCQSDSIKKESGIKGKIDKRDGTCSTFCQSESIKTERGIKGKIDKRDGTCSTFCQSEPIKTEQLIREKIDKRDGTCSIKGSLI